MKKTFTFLMMVFVAVFAAKAQNFTAGNLVAFVADDNGANNTTARIIELSPSANQTSPVKTFNIPGVWADDAKALRFSGSATSTGFLSHSNDRTLLTFTGVNTVTTSSNVNNINSRGVGTLSYNYTYNLATTYDAILTDKPQTRSATSLDNSTWFIADQSGIYTNNTTSASPSGNFRVVKAFGNVVYAGQGSAIGTLSTPSGGTFTALTGVSGITLSDFYLISSGANGSTYDVLYITSGAATNVIAKYSLVSGTWVANGTYSATGGGYAIAAEKNSGGAYLYLVSGTGANGANSITRLTDVAGYNATIDITVTNNVTLYTAAAGTTIKGIDFAPIAPTTNPVKLVSFSGKALLDNTAKFTWTTATEENFSHFELEERNGSEFRKIAHILGKNVATGANYEITTAINGNYFRLKQIDLDGKYQYSEVIFVKTKAQELTVSPNPATEKVTVQLQDNNDEKSLKLISSAGQMVKQATFKGNNYELSLSGLAKGVYYLQVVNGDKKESYTKAVLVQ